MFEEIHPQVRKREQKKKRRKFIFALISLCLVLALGTAYYATQVYSVGAAIYPDNSTGQILGTFGRLFIEDDNPLIGEEAGQINILLLGVGGNGYYGTTITDTIILASIYPANEGNPLKVSLLSIPRDTAVEIPGIEGWRKINEAYTWGELKGEGKGFEYIKDVVGDWTGVYADYYITVDFESFRDVVDAIGGVDVDVEREFTDYSYPDYSHGYLPAVHFDEGLQHMDGESALQYARSRKGNNGEGSDFSRARRQQKLLWSVKEKVRSLNVVRDIGIIRRMAESLQGHYWTNLELWEIKRFYDLVKDAEQEQITSEVLDPRTGLVCSEIDEETQLYVLRLCEGVNIDDVHKFVEKLMN